MLNPEEIHIPALGALRSEVLKQAKIELRMNLSLLEILKGNTPLESLTDLRDQWVEPLQPLIADLTKSDTTAGSAGA